METVTEQPIKKIEFFRCPQSLPGVAPLTKKPEDSGYEIGRYREGTPFTLFHSYNFFCCFRENVNVVKAMPLYTMVKNYS